MGNTTTKRQRKPLEGVKFSSDYQPSGEAKSKGKQRKKFTREVMKEMLSMKYKFTPESRIKEQLVNAFGAGVLELTVAEVMVIQQMNKAVLKADTYAFQTVMDQALGRPVQSVANTDPDGNAIPAYKLTLPQGMSIELPSNIEGDDE